MLPITRVHFIRLLDIDIDTDNIETCSKVDSITLSGKKAEPNLDLHQRRI